MLGIIVPTIEAATGVPWEHEAERRGAKIEKLDVVGIFSTTATARSRVYEIEIDKRRQDLAAFTEACPGLADMIERGEPREALNAKITGHVDALKSRIGRYPDRAILGCTHYELVADLFRATLPAGTPDHPSAAVGRQGVVGLYHPSSAVRHRSRPATRLYHHRNSEIAVGVDRGLLGRAPDLRSHRPSSPWPRKPDCVRARYCIAKQP